MRLHVRRMPWFVVLVFGLALGGEAHAIAETVRLPFPPTSSQSWGRVVAGDRVWHVDTDDAVRGTIRLTSLGIDHGRRPRVARLQIDDVPVGATATNAIDVRFALSGDAIYVWIRWCSRNDGPYPGSSGYCSDGNAIVERAQAFDLVSGARIPWAGPGELAFNGRGAYLAERPADWNTPQPLRLYDIDTRVPLPVVVPAGWEWTAFGGRVVVVRADPDARPGPSVPRFYRVVDATTAVVQWERDLADAARRGRGVLPSDSVRLQGDGSLGLRLYPRRPTRRPGIPTTVDAQGRVVTVGGHVRHAIDITTAVARSRAIVGVEFQNCPGRGEFDGGTWITNRAGTRGRKLSATYETGLWWDGRTLVHGNGGIPERLRRGLDRLSLRRGDVPRCPPPRRRRPS